MTDKTLTHLRCSLCDWCAETGGSDYTDTTGHKEEGHFSTNDTPNSVTIQKDGSPVCAKCYRAIQAVLTDYQNYDKIFTERCRKPTSTYMEDGIEVKVYKTCKPTYTPICGDYDYLKDWTEEEKERWREEYAATLKCT